MKRRRTALIASALLVFVATGMAIGGGVSELQTSIKSADDEKVLQMIDEQLALLDEAGVPESEERYQELIRQRETIFDSESKEPTPADEAIEVLGGHQPTTEIVSAVGDCEAIPGFEITVVNPRCLSIGLGTDGFLNVYLGDLGKAVVISFSSDSGPRLEEYSIPVITRVREAEISIDANNVIHVLVGGVDTRIPTDGWADDAALP